MNTTRTNPRRALGRAALGAATLATSSALMTAPAWAGSTPLPSTSGGGSAPPGVGTNIGTVIGWASWVCFVIAILGVIFVAFRMMVQHHRGEGGQHFASLLYVLGGAILVAAASGIVGVLTTAA